MTPDERAAAVREALAKHPPPTAEELREFRKRMAFDDPPADRAAIKRTEAA